MDVKAGATVGYVTALGVTAGVVTSYAITEIVGIKKPLDLAILMGLSGGLVGAFVGGALVADPATAATAPAPQVGAGRTQKVLDAVFVEERRR